MKNITLTRSKSGLFANTLKAALLIFVSCLTLSTNQAFAQSNGQGFNFRSAYPSNAKCLSISSYAGLVNTCTYSVLVEAPLQVTTGWHGTSVSLYGSNSSCQTLSTNGVGNGANLGATVWTVAGPKSWQTLNTGSIYVWDWSPLVFRCTLEAGGIIGSYWAI